MSKTEIKLAMKAIETFVETEEQDAKKNGTRQRCKNFFNVIHHIRLALQVTTELLKRVEALEEEINSLKLQ